MNTVTARAGFVENLNGPLSACRRRLTSFSSAAAVLGNVPYGVAFPTSPAAVTATTIVSLCTSMPMNRVGCSMTLSPVPEAPRQPIRRDPRSLHMTRQGHPFRAAAQGIGGGGREGQGATNDKWGVPRGGGQGRARGLTCFSSPGPTTPHYPGQETDMR